MNENDVIFKDCIMTVKGEFKSKSLDIDIFYRVIKIDDKCFVAEEISTGCIFPIFGFCNKEFEIDCISFQCRSYLKVGKYFVFANVVGENNRIGNYYLNVEAQKELVGCPTIEEINAYLAKNKGNEDFKNLMKFYEGANVFWCDIDIIKEKISEVRRSNPFYKSTVKKSGSALDCYAQRIEANPSRIDLSSIDDLGYDLASQSNLCNVVGRDEEIKRIIKNICIKKKSVMLIGESGSGKSSMIEKLALEIKLGTNEWLKNKTIFSLNTSALIADTKYRGEFSKKINKLIELCKKNRGKLIISIDEMHTLYGLGRVENSGMDAINMLKPHISNGDIIMIGATTKQEYNEYIARDEAFCRRFEKVEISNLTKKLNIQILMNYLMELESIYQLQLDATDEERKMIVSYILEITDLSHQRVIANVRINNPTLAKNVLENAFVEVKYNHKEVVTIDDICFAIIECDNLSPTIRKEQAFRLKNMIISGKKKEIREKNSNVFDFSRIKGL